MTSPADPAQPASGEPATAAKAARTSRFSRLRAAADRVPSKWFAGIATALFLAATAAFGGLNAAATPTLPEIEPGDTFENDLYQVTIERALLFDELKEVGADPKPTQRVLALSMVVENLSSSTEPTDPSSGLVSTVTLDVEGATFVTTALVEDATRGPFLHPGVPGQVVLTWLVPRREVQDGTEIELTLNNVTFLTDTFFEQGREWWGDPTPASTMTIPVELRPGDE